MIIMHALTLHTAGVTHPNLLRHGAPQAATRTLSRPHPVPL